MGLVAGCLARAHLGIGKGDFQRIEPRNHIGQFRRRHAVGQPHEVLARHIHVHQHARHKAGLHRHRFRRHFRVDMMARDELVDHVEVMGQNAVHAGDLASGDSHGRLGVRRAGEGGKTIRGVLSGELVQPQGPLIPLGITPPPIWCIVYSHCLAP